MRNTTIGCLLGVLAAGLVPAAALAQRTPEPTYDARDKPLEVLAGSTLRHGESLADRIEYTIWQRRTLRGAGTCSSQACPVHFNGEVLYARRSRVEIPGPAVAAAPAEAPAASRNTGAGVRNSTARGRLRRRRTTARR